MAILYYPYGFIGPSVTLPDENEVLLDVTYGCFSEYVGTLEPGSVTPPDYGDVPHDLSADFEDDWQWIDGVIDGGYEWGSDRKWNQDPAPTAPSSGVKMLRCNPNQEDVILAAGAIGYEREINVFIVWAQTLMDDTIVLRPQAGDILKPSGQRWVVHSVRRQIDKAQWRITAYASTSMTGEEQ